MWWAFLGCEENNSTYTTAWGWYTKEIIKWLTFVWMSVGVTNMWNTLNSPSVLSLPPDTTQIHTVFQIIRMGYDLCKKCVKLSQKCSDWVFCHDNIMRTWHFGPLLSFRCPFVESSAHWLGEHDPSQVLSIDFSHFPNTFHCHFWQANVCRS